MTPDADTMRDFVKKMYPGDSWKRRVKKMPESQVTAIYMKQQAKAAAAEARRKKESEDIPF